MLVGRRRRARLPARGAQRRRRRSAPHSGWCSTSSDDALARRARSSRARSRRRAAHGAGPQARAEHRRRAAVVEQAAARGDRGARSPRVREPGSPRGHGRVRGEAQPRVPRPVVAATDRSVVQRSVSNIGSRSTFPPDTMIPTRAPSSEPAAHRGDRNRGRRLDDLLRVLPHDLHRLEDLGLRDRDDLLTWSRMIANVRSERPVSNPSAIVVGGSDGWRTPVVSERAASSASSGSAPSTRDTGLQAVRGERGAGQQPATADRRDDEVESRRPRTRAPARRCRRPRSPRRCRTGCISTAPVRATTSASVLGARLGRVLAVRDRGAVARSPRPSSPSRTDSGMTTYAGMPRVAAASASAAAWLPDECAATPLRASASESDCTALVAPRYLNAPMRWRCSPFRYTLVPSHRSSVLLVSTGVRWTNGPMRVAAARTSSNVAATSSPRAGRVRGSSRSRTAR